MQKLILTNDVVIDLYNLKYSSRFIGNVFHCSHYTIIRVLKENNIKIRTSKEARQIRLNDDAYNKRVGKSVSEYYKEHKITRSKEEKKQISEKLRGHEVLDITKKKISDSLEGRKLTKEHRENIAKAQMDRVFPFKDTSIEIQVQNILNKNKIPFEKHIIIPNLLSGNRKYHKFDIVLRNHKILIEVNGCYWHGCHICYKKPNNLQLKKINRDKKMREDILKSDWMLIEIWEHDLMKYKGYESNKNINKLLNSFNLKKED